MHLQTNKLQDKLLTVVKGKLLDVALDCRKKSKTFGKHFRITLSEENNYSIYIPEGFAHSFCALKKDTLLHYKCTNYRNARSEIGILWNDPALKIKWPISKPIISSKDKVNLSFAEFNKKNTLNL